MAISHVQPLLLLLLATIFFLPALCIDVDFEYCNKSGYDFGNITRVQYNPSTGMLVPAELFIFGYARNFNIKVVTVSLKMDNSTVVVVQTFDNVRLFDWDKNGHYTLYLARFRGSYIPSKDYKIVISYIDDSEEDSPKTVMCFEFAQLLGDKKSLIDQNIV